MSRLRIILAGILVLAGLGTLHAAPALSPVGKPRVLVLLVEFQDLTFTVPDPAGSFERMLNQEGYREFGGTGSVRDYFNDNSQGLFVPSFEVVGPVRLSKPVSAYGKDVYSGGVRKGDVAPELALSEACALVDGQVNFARYDSNFDGTVDLVLYYFAGHDQAAGASSERLWSQMGDARTSEDASVRSARFDRRRLGTFLCTSELSGISGTTFCGIGLTCHELGHALGLPDLYDTDGTLNGQAGGPWMYSPMGRGCYNNDGRTPPYFSAQERLLLGWMDASRLSALPEGPVRLLPVQEQAACQSATATADEYYLYEYRNGQGWDAPLAAGIVVYHVDRSTRSVGGIPARDLWDKWAQYNTLNARAGHPCFYAVLSSDPDQLTYSPAVQSGYVVFPGLAEAYTYEPQDWEGRHTGVQLTNLEVRSPQEARAYVVSGTGSHLNGVVRNSAGDALAGVQVKLDGQYKTATNTGGFFKVDVQEGQMPALVTLTLSRNGYRSRQLQLTTGNRHVYSVPAVLRQEGEADEQELSFYSRQALTGYYPRKGLCAVCYQQEDLAPYVGNLLSRVDLYPCVGEDFSGRVYLTVDVGARRELTRILDNRLILPGQYRKVSVDISDAGIVIPEGLDIYVGYGTAEESNGFRVGTAYPAEKGRSFFTPFDMNYSHWEDLFQEESGYWMDVLLNAHVAEQGGVEALENLGYNYIDPGTGTYRAGDVFPLKLVTAPGSQPYLERWTCDGVRLTSGELVLTEGRHSLSVYLDYGDGRTEVLELELDVQPD